MRINLGLIVLSVFIMALVTAATTVAVPDMLKALALTTCERMRQKRTVFDMSADPEFYERLRYVTVALESLKYHRAGKNRFRVLIDRGVRGTFQRALVDLGADSEFNLDSFYFDNITESVRTYKRSEMEVESIIRVQMGDEDDEDNWTDWTHLLQTTEMQWPGIVTLIASCMEQDDSMQQLRANRAVKVITESGMGPISKKGRSLPGFRRQ